MKIKATTAQCNQLYTARNSSDKKRIKKSVFTAIRNANGLQGSAKLGVRNITNPDKDNFGVLYDKRTRVDLNDGRPEPTVSRPAVSKPTSTVAKPVVKTTAVTAKPAAKTASKPASVAAKKPIAKPTAKSSTKLGSPVRTDKYCIEVRTTILGQRKRLGFASSQTEKEKMISAAKA